ncbi:MAG: heavy-metal-associated domain-containing protein [Nitrospinae bacterium]|nr:heavy-metal-associated domain-containing protein [Nitrospinota bacterium]
MLTKTITIEGMSCGHCAEWVTGALKGLAGVENAQVSLEAKNAVVDLDETKVTDEMLSNAVIQAGYTVKGIS